MKKDILDKNKVRIIDDEQYPTEIYSISGISIVCPATSELFTNEIKRPFASNVKLSDKEILALELYGASHYEKSERASFLTLILALESLLEPKKRSNKTINHVKLLKEQTKCADIPENERNSILGSLEWLNSESISQGIKRMVNTFLKDKEYSGMPSIKFVTHCYDMRSKLVHTGKTPDSVDLGALAAQLNVLLSDLLEGKIYA